MINFFNSLQEYAINNNGKVWELNFPDDKNTEFINNIYESEPYPIFEQNWIHIFSYLKFQSKLYALECDLGKFIFVEKDNNLNLFTPLLINGQFKKMCDQLGNFYKSLGFKEMTILNISDDWRTKYEKELKKLKNESEIIPRSKEEVVYDISILTKLEGKKFAKLRNIRNKLLESKSVNFVRVDTNNINLAIQILEEWQKVQGHKYTKNKFEKECFVIKSLNNFNTYSSLANIYLCISKTKTLGLIVFFEVPTHPKWSVIYMVKGINRSNDGGLHGVSDAMYLFAFQKLNELGVKYVNDGELGSEQGTRDHKLNFLPIMYLKSYDIKLRLS